MTDDLRARITEALIEWTRTAARTPGAVLMPDDEARIRDNSLARADAVMAVVRPKLDRLRSGLGQAVLEFQQAHVGRAKAEAAIERVRALHQPKSVRHVRPCDSHRPQEVCSSCEVYEAEICSNVTCCGYPCPTIAALDQPEETT